MNDDKTQKQPISIIIPAYNEEDSLEQTVEKLSKTLSSYVHEIIIINDGSTDGTAKILESISTNYNLTVLTHKENMGYGASLKHALKVALHNTIVITDADGTYPINKIPELLEHLTSSDMVVGARIGQNVHRAFFRKIGRDIVRRFASFIAEVNIPDINSGLRVFYKADALRFFRLYPDGFSFTTTITVAYHIKKYKVVYVPIDYYKRSGRSSIKPVKDFIGFMSLLTRLAVYFKPLRVFTPAFIILFTFSWIILLGGMLNGQIFDVSWALLLITSIQVLSFGLLADMIIKRIYND